MCSTWTVTWSVVLCCPTRTAWPSEASSFPVARLPSGDPLKSRKIMQVHYLEVWPSFSATTTDSIWKSINPRHTVQISISTSLNLCNPECKFQLMLTFIIKLKFSAYNRSLMRRHPSLSHGKLLLSVVRGRHLLKVRKLSKLPATIRPKKNNKIHRPAKNLLPLLSKLLESRDKRRSSKRESG